MRLRDVQWPSLGEGLDPFRTPGKKDKPLRYASLESGRDEKARSVVALSRVPRLAGFAGSPPAAGLSRRLTGLLSGSPPPTHDHRHVRNWASRVHMRIGGHYKNFFRTIQCSRRRCPQMCRCRRSVGAPRQNALRLRGKPITSTLLRRSPSQRNPASFRVRK